MNKVRKILAVMLVLLLAVSGAAGCTQTPTTTTAGTTAGTTTAGTTTEGTTAEGTTAAPETTATTTEAPITDWRADTSPITIDVYFNASWLAMVWTTDIETSTFAYITKKTGVTVNILTPTGSESEKMNTMIASGDVPDVIMANVWDKETQSLIAAGLVQPLNKLADEYDKSFYDIVAPSQIGWFTKPDGNIYDYPNFANAYEKVMQQIETQPEVAKLYGGDRCLAVRKDMYEALGSPDMTQPEGFLAGLQAAKDMFPTVDGQPLIPINFAEMSETGSQLLNDGISWLANVPAYTADGKMNDMVNDPEYLRWLKTLRKANEMGLISKDIFIDKRAQIEEKTLGGRYFISAMGKSDIAGNNDTLYSDLGGKDTGIYYVPLDAMRNSKADDPAIRAKIMLDGWMNSYITTKAKDTARTFRFLNYMMGPEGQHDANYGEEGVAWDYVDGVETFKPFVFDGSMSGDDLAKNYAVNGNNWLWWNSDIMNTFPIPESPFSPRELFEEYAAKYIVFQPEFSGITLEAGSAEAQARSNIDVEWGTTVTKLVMAESDAEFDQILADFNTKRAELGYEAMMAAQQKILDANREKLGVTDYN